ncbi:hypothetical protein TWF694_006717 [Orbilia ellipsospora]|uniref:DUF1772-domain-containing protein n=1 Tax=Orbilia ellipsospora TaxID=2528407 RepID=A0AAV9XLW3_9PEZI
MSVSRDQYYFRSYRGTMGLAPGYRVGGVITTSVLTGMLLSHSLHSTPLLLQSDNHRTILEQFRLLKVHSTRTAMDLALTTSLFFSATSIIRLRYDDIFGSLRYIFASVAVLGLLPYHYLIMGGTERRLATLYSEEVNQPPGAFISRPMTREVVVKGEVRELVDRWGLLNLGRVVGVAVGLFVGPVADYLFYSDS